MHSIIIQLKKYIRLLESFGKRRHIITLFCSYDAHPCFSLLSASSSRVSWLRYFRRSFSCRRDRKTFGILNHRSIHCWNCLKKQQVPSYRAIFLPTYFFVGSIFLLNQNEKFFKETCFLLSHSHWAPCNTVVCWKNSERQGHSD